MTRAQFHRAAEKQTVAQQNTLLLTKIRIPVKILHHMYHVQFTTKYQVPSVTGIPLIFAKHEIFQQYFVLEYLFEIGALLDKVKAL